jgi:hypothetical protein
VLAGSVVELATRSHPERSPVGIGLTAASLLVMPLLGWRKRRVGSALRNPFVLADAAETILCARLAATTLPGLLLFAASARGSPIRSPPWPSPGSRYGRAAKPGTANWPVMTDYGAALWSAPVLSKPGRAASSVLCMPGPVMRTGPG